MSLVYQGVRSSNGTVAACFNPRHGIHATRQGRTVDLLICFECLQIEIFEAERKIAGVLTSRSVEADVDALYEAAGLHSEPRAKRATGQ